PRALMGTSARPGGRTLRIPAVARAAPAAGARATLAAAPPAQLLTALEGATPSPDVTFQRARAYLELGDWQQAADLMVALAASGDEDWRVWWWEGVLDLANGEYKAACEAFEKVAAELPGELAPLLALATANESAGQQNEAAPLYDLVSATDPSYATAAFGLARSRRTMGDRHGAAAALHRVPPKSSAYQAAQARLCRILSENGAAGAPNVDDLMSASSALAHITGDPRVRAALTPDILTPGLSLIGPHPPPHPPP